MRELFPNKRVCVFEACGNVGVRAGVLGGPAGRRGAGRAAAPLGAGAPPPAPAPRGGAAAARQA